MPRIAFLLLPVLLASVLSVSPARAASPGEELRRAVFLPGRAPPQERELKLEIPVGRTTPAPVSLSVTVIQINLGEETQIYLGGNRYHGGNGERVVHGPASGGARFVFGVTQRF